MSATRPDTSPMARRRRSSSPYPVPDGISPVAGADVGPGVGEEFGSGPQRAPGKPAAPPVTVVDWLMLVLALVSIGLLVWIWFFDVSERTADRVLVADAVICGIFFIEFCVRWRRSHLGLRFPVVYWYELVGMIPAAIPLPVNDLYARLFRLLRIFVVLSRLARAADRAFGDRATAYVVGRFSGALVGAIRKPVTVAVLDEVIAVVQTGNYAQHVAAAIEENRNELDALIVDLIKADATTRRFRYVPFHDEIVKMVSDTVFRIVNGALADPRVHELISDAIKVSAIDLRANVRASLVEEQRRVGGRPA